MDRWYEKHTVLSRNIDLMKDMNVERRDCLLLGIMKIIKASKPSLLDDFVADFPLEIHRKRWYDKDPYLWLIINGLQYGSVDLISEIEFYLSTQSDQFSQQSD